MKSISYRKLLPNVLSIPANNFNTCLRNLLKKKNPIPDASVSLTVIPPSPPSQIIRTWPHLLWRRAARGRAATNHRLHFYLNLHLHMVGLMRFYSEESLRVKHGYILCMKISLPESMVALKRSMVSIGNLVILYVNYTSVKKKIVLHSYWKDQNRNRDHNRRVFMHLVTVTWVFLQRIIMKATWSKGDLGKAINTQRNWEMVVRQKSINRYSTYHEGKAMVNYA